MKMIKFLTRKYSLLGSTIMQNAWSDGKRCSDLTLITDYAKDIEGVNDIWRLDENWIEEVSQKYVSVSTDVFWHYLKLGQDYGYKLTASSRELFENTNLSSSVLSENKLDIFLRWRKDFHNNAAFLLITHPLAKAIEIRLLDIFRKYGIPQQNFEQMLLDLSITRKSNGSEEENFDLLQIQRQLNNQDFDLEAALIEHTRKHAYLKYREPFSGGYNIDFFRKRLQEKLEIPNYFLPYAPIVSSFNKSEQEITNILEEFVFYRTFRTERSYESLYYLECFLAEIEESQKLEIHELSYYSENELINFLQSGERMNSQLLNERRNGFCVLLHNSVVTILSGETMQNWIKNKMTESKINTEQIRGLTACTGIAQGFAKIVTNSEMQDTVCEGDILIVTMTTPDFLPSMKKAAAFVTDEGGIICHAAIIARELRKPCIIGTRHATSIFKNGDFVEVNGYQGIVRLIRRQE